MLKRNNIKLEIKGIGKRRGIMKQGSQESGVSEVSRFSAEWDRNSFSFVREHEVKRKTLTASVSVCLITVLM